MHYNKFSATVIGNIGNVETINEGTEQEFSKFSLACNGRYVSKIGEEVQTIDWVDVILSKKQKAEIFTKGRKVLVEGVPTVNAYIDKEGKPQGKLVIVAPRIEFLDSKKGEEKADEVEAFDA